jgi:hypothetical protein
VPDLCLFARYSIQAGALEAPRQLATAVPWLHGSWQPGKAATQLGYAHRRLSPESPPLPTEADGKRIQTARRYRPLRVVPLPRGQPRARPLYGT